MSARLLLALLSGLAAALRVPPPAASGRQWPSSLEQHLRRGFVRTVREAGKHGRWRAAQKAATLSWLMVEQLLIFPARMLPFAVRTVRYRRRAVDERAPFELFSAPAGDRGGAAATGPLVLYVHGGSWGQGAPWQYALLAKRLLEAGASRVAIVRYRLFPAADVDEMVGDVAEALRWAGEQADERRVGSSTPRSLPVVLAAQSAGAHLCALAFARASCAAAAEAVASAARGVEAERGGAAAAASTARPGSSTPLPDRFVALSGVFDVPLHFAHETGRGVHWMSPMWLAMIGRRTAGEAQATQAEAAATQAAEEAAAEAEAAEAELLAIALEKLGLSPATAAGAARAASNAVAGAVPGAAELASQLSRAALERATEADGRSRSGEWRVAELAAFIAASPTRLLLLERLLRLAGAEGVASADHWPPTVALHAADDGTVPVSSGREFVAALRANCADGEAQRAARWVEEESGGHGELMVSLMGRQPLEACPGGRGRLVRAFVLETVRGTSSAGT